MNYRHVYMCIIAHAKSEQKLGNRPKSKYLKKHFSEAYEFHHILPRSIFPNWVKRKDNIVPLTPREHFFCHQLLTKIYPGSNMACALFRLSHISGRKISSTEYDAIKNEMVKEKRLHINKELSDWTKNKSAAELSEIKSKMSASAKLRWETGNAEKCKETQFKKGNIPWNYGKTHSAETKKKLSENHITPPVYADILNVETGEVFATLKDAEKAYPKATKILRVILGVNSTSGGYHWECHKMNYLKRKNETNPAILKLWAKVGVKD